MFFAKLGLAEKASRRNADAVYNAIAHILPTVTSAECLTFSHASEQERPDVKAARQRWSDSQPELDPDSDLHRRKRAFNQDGPLARLRAPRGQRCHAAIPHGHWKTVTFVGGLTLGGFIAPMLLDGPMDGEVFRAWCEQMLAPLLQPGHIVVMDNLAAHKVEGSGWPSKLVGQPFSTCRPIVPTSIPSRMPSPS